VEEVGSINVFIKKIPLSPFSMMKIQRYSGELNLGDLKKLKRKYRVVYVVAEPIDKKVHGWKVNKHPFLPSKTIVIDLRKDEKKLWKDLSTNAKRILKKDSLVQTIELRGKKDRRKFYKNWKKAAHTWLMSEERFNKLIEAFGEDASLWVSKKGDSLLSGIILLKSGDTVNYFQTWTSEAGRRSGSHYHLVWQVILECKRQSVRWFDFEGILDERWPQKRWAGFSEFKKRFGGKVISYPGSFVKWFYGNKKALS